MVDNKFLKITYRKILNDKDLDNRKTSKYLSKLGEPHTLIILVSKNDYKEIENNNFEPLVEAYYTYRHTNANMAVVSYGQLDDVQTLEVDGEELSYSNNPVYKTRYLSVDLVSVEDATEVDLYRQRLSAHDWSYAYSDDRKVFNNGSSSFNIISSMKKRLDTDGSIWNEYAPEGFKSK